MLGRKVVVVVVMAVMVLSGLGIIVAGGNSSSRTIAPSPNHVHISSSVNSTILTQPTQSQTHGYMSDASASYNKLASPLKNNYSSDFAINPFSLYFNEPAPMGLADYGVINPGIFETTYVYNTTSFLGGASINSLSTGSNNITINQQMTFQFNINLAFYNGATLYVYWVQDVAFVNTSTNQIFFIDNIWNMSGPSANIQNSTLTGNGTIGDSSGTYYYYDIAGSSLPGNYVNLKYPSNLQFMMNSTVKGGYRWLISCIMTAMAGRLTIMYYSHLSPIYQQISASL